MKTELEIRGHKTGATLRKKENPKAFFNPEEWAEFVYHIPEKHRFYFWFLVLTGMRYNEAKNVKVEDIDWNNKWINVRKAKGGRNKMRESHLSTYGTRYIKSYIKVMGLKKKDEFSFPSLQHMIRLIKDGCKKIGMKDWKDMSVHNLRKTHENYLISLDKPPGKILLHMGHTGKVAMTHYVSGAFIKNKKQYDLIDKWLGDMFNIFN